MIEEITEVSAEPIKVTLVYGNTEATINQDKKKVLSFKQEILMQVIHCR